MPILRMTRLGVVAFGACLGFAAVAEAQAALVDLLQRHGVAIADGNFEAAFDAGLAPTVPVTPGSFAAPLAVLTTATGGDRDRAAYAFAILAGRSPAAASAGETAAAGRTFVQMIGASDRRARIVGARVAGRVFALPFDAPSQASPGQVPRPDSGPGKARPALPDGLVDGLFALLNQSSQTEQLAAMDALGLIRETTAVTALSERYQYYREAGTRGLAGGALEALARIGHQSTVETVKRLAGDQWAEGSDATALAVAFARERLLKDGSIALIHQALNDRSRRDQARGYLSELGAPVP